LSTLSHTPFWKCTATILASHRGFIKEGGAGNPQGFEESRRRTVSNAGWIRVCRVSRIKHPPPRCTVRIGLLARGGRKTELNFLVKRKAEARHDFGVVILMSFRHVSAGSKLAASVTSYVAERQGPDACKQKKITLEVEASMFLLSSSEVTVQVRSFHSVLQKVPAN